MPGTLREGTGEKARAFTKHHTANTLAFDCKVMAGDLMGTKSSWIYGLYKAFLNLCIFFTFSGLGVVISPGTVSGLERALYLPDRAGIVDIILNVVVESSEVPTVLATSDETTAVPSSLNITLSLLQTPSSILAREAQTRPPPCSLEPSLQ